MTQTMLQRRAPKRHELAQVLGIGTALPIYAIDQADAAIIAQEIHVTKRWHQALPALYRKSGVNHRGSVLLNSDHGSPTNRQSFYQLASPTHPLGPTTSERMRVYAEEASPLLLRAAESAIECSHCVSTDITHVITVSCTGFSAPGIDLQLIQQLGLSAAVQRTHVGYMGCHGAINGLRMAKAIVESDPNAMVLLGAVELCSIHQQYTDDPQQLVANSLFADGAAAMVLGSKSVTSIDSLNFDAATSPSPWRVASTFSQVIPETFDLMSWTIGDHGFQMTLDPQVPSCIESHLRCHIADWLEEEMLDLEKIDAWAIHPGGPRIVQASGAALGLSSDQIEPSLSMLANHGNMSSPTVLFILDQLTRTNRSAENIVLLAFGPGLCIEACLLTRNSLST